MKLIKRASITALFIATLVLSSLSGCVSVHRDAPASTTTTTSSTVDPVVPASTTVQRTTSY